ncbi:MAG: DUF814 domain-containing protein [Desulfovibrionaceae bacterium]|nr:DUF814 domain-containing protein [Desulfovibrionaceae bacterium]
MDAHLFRRLCDALIPALCGARMEKIHQPDQDVSIFTLYGGGLARNDGLEPGGRDPARTGPQAAPGQSGGRLQTGGPAKRYLVLRADRKAPLLFLSAHRVPAGAQPPAPVMRLRKHLSGRHIVRALCHWIDRRLYLETSGGVTLLLDVREGPSLLFESAPAFDEPAWPGAPRESSPAALCEGELWRAWPALTPALRRTLPRLEPEEGRALLMDLQAGGGDVFLYEGPGGERQVSAWPLPEALRAGMRESVWGNPLPALALAGESQVYAALAARARQTAAQPFLAEARRLDALLDKLDRDQARLAAMRDRQADALLLQASLYRLDRNTKLSALTLDSPDGPRELSLNPRLSVRENMDALFHQAARGRRGLEHLARRREAVLAERDAALGELMRREAAGTGGAAPLPGQAKGDASARPGRRDRPGGPLPRQVQMFRSSDGFILLRGRDSKGNALALRLAAPHDYWLHTADGPGAHVIIRRDHAGHAVPERTLMEAGALAALKSPLRDAAGADIQYSLAKYIHPMKNAGPGMVRIDKSEGSFRVSPDPGLEERLSREEKSCQEERLSPAKRPGQPQRRA